MFHAAREVPPAELRQQLGAAESDLEEADCELQLTARLSPWLHAKAQEWMRWKLASTAAGLFHTCKRHAAAAAPWEVPPHSPLCHPLPMPADKLLRWEPMPVLLNSTSNSYCRNFVLKGLVRRHRCGWARDCHAAFS